jgi:hypothetical protein
MRRAILLGCAMLMAGCQTNPKQTVLELDTTDKRWTSRQCVLARKAAADYDDGQRARGVVGLADYVAPFAGTVASALMSWRKDPQRAELNAIVQRHCVTPDRLATQESGPYRIKPYRGASQPKPKPRREVRR